MSINIIWEQIFNQECNLKRYEILSVLRVSNMRNNYPIKFHYNMITGILRIMDNVQNVKIEFTQDIRKQREDKLKRILGE